MNIFMLDFDPRECAASYCDEHIARAIMDNVYMLKAAHTICGDGDPRKTLSAPLLAQVRDNPSCQWARMCVANYRWLHDLTGELSAQHGLRFGKPSGWGVAIAELTTAPKRMLLHLEITPLPLTMPIEFIQPSVIESYRTYYVQRRAKDGKWSLPAQRPHWWERYQQKELASG